MQLAPPPRAPDRSNTQNRVEYSARQDESVSRLIQRPRVPIARALPLPQMAHQRVPPAKHLPAPSDHRDAAEVEQRRVADDLGRHPEVDRVLGGDPTADPCRDVRIARVRLDVALQVRGAAVALDVWAVWAFPAV